jgi:hypothetical protein
MTVPASRADRWVLVGGRHTGGDSRVAVEIGPAAAVLLPADRLSLFALQGHAPMVVRVADFGNARDGEVLRIEEYTDR